MVVRRNESGARSAPAVNSLRDANFARVSEKSRVFLEATLRRGFGCYRTLNADLHIQSRALVRILVILFLLTLPLVNPWVRGDGVGYYVYACASLIEHNLHFTRAYRVVVPAVR